MQLKEIESNSTYSIELNYEENEILKRIVECIIEYINAIGYKATYSINSNNNFELKLFVPEFTAKYILQQLEFEYSLFA